MAKYSDYFDIDEEFFSAVNQELIEEGKVDWKKFFPHEKFIQLIKDTIKILTKKQHLSIWVEGGYGTGKSYAALTIKKMLEADESEIRDYFKKFNLNNDLCNSFISARGAKEKVLTVHKYGAQSLRNENDLVLAVQTSIIKAIEEKGLTYKGEKSLKDSVINWLSIEQNSTYFDSIIKQHYLAEFGGDNVEKLLVKIKTYDGNELIELMNKIFRVANDWGIIALKMTKDDIVSWIKDVIKGNNLKSIVFIWDEFTKYFENNMSDLTSFQRIAEISETDPFYLIIVTHKSQGIFSEKDGDGKLISGRFISPTILITLPDTMAFKLMASAMEKTKDDVLLSEWKDFVGELYNRTNDSRNAVLSQLKKDDPTFSDEDLCNILPMHPYAALLLKYLSAQFASNQRSMFDFIKNDKDDNIHGFQWYIKNYGPLDDQPLLTIDMLWNFFYENGKEQLASDIRTVLNHYNNSNPNALFDREKRVLKTILLLTAISQSLGNSVDLFIPTATNIANSFEGIEDLEGNTAISIANNLVDKKILFKKKTKDKEYYAPLMVAVDSSKKSEFEQLIDSYKTSKFVYDAGFNVDDLDKNPNNRLIFNPPLSVRFDIKLVASDNLQAMVKASINNPKFGKIPAFICFSKNDAEMASNAKIIKECLNSSESKDLNIVYIESKVPLGMDLYNRYKDSLSDSMTFQGNDNGSQKQREKDALSVLNKEWGSKIEDGNFSICWYNDNNEFKNDNVAGIDDLKSYLLKTVDSTLYPCGFEWRYRVGAGLYKLTAGKQGVKSALLCSCEGPYNNPNKNLKTEQVVESAWKTSLDTKYWETNPTMPISILKKAIEEKISKDFENDGRVSISAIFDIAKSKPFGLMPVNLSAFILGFILRDYANDQYRYSDDTMTDSMTNIHLQTMIEEVLKNQDNPSNRYREKYIVTMTAEEKEFHRISSEVFNIPLSQCSSITATRDKIRISMKSLSFPIWSLNYELENQNFETDDIIVKDAIACFGQIANNGQASEVEIANKLGKLSLDNPELINDLKEFIKLENCRSGMNRYLRVYSNGELITLANKINDNGLYLSEVANRFKGSDAANWVWNQNTANQQIDAVILSYKIIEETNKILGKNHCKLQDAVDEWKTQAGMYRISYSCMMGQIGQIEQLIKNIYEIKRITQLMESSEKEFYDNLVRFGSDYKDFYDNQRDLFKKICSFYLNDLSDNDVKTIYNSIPNNGTFISDKTDYLKLVSEKVQDFKKNQKKEQLKQLWKEKTNTDNPKTWSEINKTPILSLVPMNEINTAKRAFNCFEAYVQSNDEIDSAINYLKNAEFFKMVSNTDKIDEAFRSTILKSYGTIIKDLVEIRKYLYEHVIEVYDWFENSLVDSLIHSYAEHIYSTESNVEVINIINSMTDQELKKYLEELAKNNVELGIQILKNKK